jgi:hypothetical protein
MGDMKTKHYIGIELTYNISECICPVVKENGIESPYMCHCTKGPRVQGVEGPSEREILARNQCQD